MKFNNLPGIRNRSYGDVTNDYVAGPLENITNFEYPIRAEQGVLQYLSFVTSCLPVKKDFAQLRTATNFTQEVQLAQRLIEVPEKTAFENRLGVYIEEIDPQVRRTVVDFNFKGYSTYESGFYFGGALQGISGNFLLDQDTIAKLHNVGAYVFPLPSEHTTTIVYKPVIASLDHMKNRWNKIESILPPVEYIL